MDALTRRRAVQEEGNALHKQGSYRAAVAIFSQALAMEPDSHVLWSNRSASHLSMRQPVRCDRNSAKSTCIGDAMIMCGTSRRLRLRTRSEPWAANQTGHAGTTGLGARCRFAEPRHAATSIAITTQLPATKHLPI